MPVAPPGYFISPTGRVRPKPGMVAHWDLSTRTVLRDEATGLIKLIHWVDQAVALALGVEQGGVTSNPELGHTLRKIKRGAAASLDNDAKDAVRQALNDLIKRGDIAVVGFATDTSRRSQLIVKVSYINLRITPPRDTQIVTLAV